MQDSIFTKIIKGEIPCHKIYEDERTLAFLDIHPVQPGMVVVVPKRQVENFEDLELDDYTAVWATVQKVAKQLRHVFPQKAKIAVQVEGFDVPHAHVKVFPVSNAAEFRAHADMTSEPDHAILGEVAKKLAF